MKTERLLALAYLVTNCLLCVAQSTAVEAPNGDLAATLRVLESKNGLQLQLSTPWHIKISWDQFDEDGDNVHSGTIDEVYVGPKRYKTIYAGDAFNETATANDSGLYLSGEAKWPDVVELQVWNAVLQPLHRAEVASGNRRLATATLKLGAATMQCVAMHRTDAIETGPLEFCYDPGTQRLRYAHGVAWDETVYNNLVLFQDRYVARDVTVTTARKPFLKIHIETLEASDHVEEATFAPPPGIAPVAGRLHVPSRLLADEYGIKQGELSSTGEKGVVNVRFVVGKDGEVIEAVALDGPPGLRKEAVKTMRRFKFRPFLVLDRPVEVEATMQLSWM